MSFIQQYLAEATQILQQLDTQAIDRVVALLAETRARGGRLFILGVGGSAANASHAVNDFRKIVGLEAYAPTDNVAELTARTNDEGWASVFVGWLQTSRLRADDLVCVFSVGGGNVEKNVSPNLVAALQFARQVGDTDYRGRGARWGLYRAGGRCLYPRPHGERQPRHPPHGSVSGGGLAFTGDAPGLKSVRDEMGVGAVNAAVFLDRDGVLNQTIVRMGCRIRRRMSRRASCYPGSGKPVSTLRSAGYLLFVVTNQPDVARGHQSREHVEGINAWIQSTLPVQQVLTCYHDTCRSLRLPQAEARHVVRRQHRRGTWPYQRVSWWATAGVMSRPGGLPAAGVF